MGHLLDARRRNLAARGRSMTLRRISTGAPVTVTVVGTLLTHSLAVGIAAILTSCLVPAAYSFLLARRLPPEV